MAKCENCKELEVKNIWGKVPYEWCEKKNDNPHKNIERDCPYFKPKTNADRIRSMTDEELAEHFSGLIRDTKEHEYCQDKDDWLKWLKSEVGCE